ncbi:MAG: hypothetical protein LBH22_07305, partial [Bacteroidales bacterium]|nr:hypothetical protein [Bacteroidales bacterium]
MKKQLTIFALFLLCGLGYAQFERVQTLFENKAEPKREIVSTETATVERTISNSTAPASPKAMWDIAFQFAAVDAQHVGWATNGNKFYSARWTNNAPTWAEYDMDGSNPVTFTVPGVTEVRALTFDGTYFYAANTNANRTIFKIDMTTKTLVSQFNAICAGVTGIRHMSYDPTLDGGNGGFWIGNWSELGAVSMTGAQLIAS